jgi:cytochrome c oxidase subunit 4
MAYQGHLSAEQELELEHRHEHPGNAEYVRIAIILAVITLAEVVIWYVEKVKDLLVPSLIIMSIAKFLLVVGYFMHLKFDNPFFRYVFFFGLGVALCVFIATGFLFEAHKAVTFFSDLT